MFIEVVKSKLHKVTVTDANLQYVGSITIDEALLEAANMIENEKVQIVNINNGERFDTYIIKGERDSGIICLNGPAARKCAVGDVIIGQDGHVGLIPAGAEWRQAAQAAGYVEGGPHALRRGFLVAGCSVDLAGEPQMGHGPGLEGLSELCGIRVIVLNGVTGAQHLPF